MPRAVAIVSKLRPVTVPGDFFRARRNLVARVIDSREHSLSIQLLIRNKGRRAFSPAFIVSRDSFEQLFADRLRGVRELHPDLCRCGECPDGTPSLG